MKNYIVTIITALILISCAESTGEESKQIDDSSEWCADVIYGTFEGETSDGIKVKLTLEQMNEYPYYVESDGFFLDFVLPDGRVAVPESGSKIMEFMEFDGTVNNIKRGVAIVLKPYGMYCEDEYLEAEDFKLGEIKITYLSSDEIKLEFAAAQNAINEMTSSSYGESVNSMILTKVSGVNECYDFDPMISYDNDFSDDEVMFINGFTMVGETRYTMVKKELMLDYMLRKSDNSMGYWNKGLEEYGAVYKLDFNGDGANDICGYFSSRSDNSEKLVFKILLNNGASFSDVYTKNLTNYSGGDEILVPGKMNGNDIIDATYLDEGGYYLFYNKLTDEIEEVYND